MLSVPAKRNVKKGIVACFLVWVVTLLLQDGGQEETTKVKVENVQISLHSYEVTEPPKDKLLILRTAIYQLPRPADEKYAINETKSQNISVIRDIPDTRPPQCLTTVYNISSLPTISVVIPMYNEAPSMVLRTVHSILSRTPPSLLADVIIVDDMSTNENLKQAFTDYIWLLSSKIKLVRLKKKAHLIKARMAGASIAKGDVLLFQDAHTEINAGWAEPILDYIRTHRKTIVQPTIDAIDQWTINYQTVSDHSNLWRGVFLWDMRYAWNRVPDYYRAWLTSDAMPYPCPVLVGCSIAVDRGYFYEIGGFDTGLDVYGGEQIELSFRTWMCGGNIVIHPCSRVGHVFKPGMQSDIHWKDREQAIARNSIRLGESWMGSYVSYYYASNRIYNFKRIQVTQEEKAGILGRRQLAKELGCKDFDWYLANIVPELNIPEHDSNFFGEVSNSASSMCLTATDDGYVGLTADCYIYSRYQQEGEFSFRSNGKLMHGTRCAVVNGVFLIELVSCDKLPASHGKITFRQTGSLLTQGFIVYEEEGYEDICLEQVTNILPQHNEEQMPQFKLCSNVDPEFGLWVINYHFEYDLVPPPLFDEDVRVGASRP